MRGKWERNSICQVDGRLNAKGEGGGERGHLSSVVCLHVDHLVRVFVQLHRHQHHSVRVYWGGEGSRGRGDEGVEGDEGERQMRRGVKEKGERV